MTAALNKKFSFGDVTVDPQSNLITVVGKEKRLEPKLIALLMYLAQHSRQVITRQQITDTIWAGVIVGEESITQAIFSLRNALGDDAKRPKYIETIPKKGYRFVADIVDIESQKIEAIPDTPQRHWITAGLQVILTLLSFMAWHLLKSKPNYEVGSVLPVTKLAGAECCMAIRGNKMAFINIVDASTDIYIKDLNTGIEERITADDWRKGPASWLNDNTLIYPRCSDSECQIVQQTLHKTPQIIYTSPAYIGQLTLAPNNPSLFIFNEQNETSNFIAYDLRSGTMTELGQDYPELPPYSLAPQFSPDAQQLYFLTIAPKPILMRLDFASKKIEAVTDHFTEITSFSVVSAEQLIIAGTHQTIAGLWSLEDFQTKPSLIIRPSGDEKFLSPLLHGTNIYYQSTLFDRDIGVITSTKITHHELTEINSTGIDEWSTRSKDGQFVYFVSNRSGYSEVWRHDLTRKQTKQITHLKTITLVLILPSNDGQRFSAMYTENLQPMLGVFSVHTGELLASVKSQSYPLGWSPDDKNIYVKDYNNNVPVLSRYDSQTLTRTIIQKNAGLFAQESDDGKTLTFVDFTKNALIERTLATGQDQVLIKPDFKLDEIWTGRLRLNTTKTSMFVVKQHQDVHQLWQYSLIGNDRRKLVDLPKHTNATYISEDGTQIYYDEEMPATGNIMKIELK